VDEADSLPLSNRALWAALRQMRLPAPDGALGFQAALVEATGWPIAFARRAIAEYRRFLFLAATSGGELTPSNAVDQVWHLHLEQPHYEETLCARILGRPLDHRPGTGEEEDQPRFRRQYLATLRLYEDVFADRPPRDVWPSAPEAGRPTARPRTPSSGRRNYLRFLPPASLAVGGAAAAATGSSGTGAALLLVAAFLTPFAFRVPGPLPGRGPSGAPAGCEGAVGACGSGHGGHGHAGCGGHSGCGGHGGCGGGGCGGH